MKEAEKRGLPYVLKLKKSGKVKVLIKEVFFCRQWVEAGQGWEGVEARLQLMGWTKARRVIVLRREIREGLVLIEDGADDFQLEFGFMEMGEPVKKYGSSTEFVG
jgi:hypothetical protein